MNLVVNGEAMELPAGLSAAELLERLGVRVAAVAVEVNRQVVPRSRLREVRLAPGDRVEVVTLVGGG